MKTLNIFSGMSVDNLEKAKDFYVNVLGLELSNEKMGLQLKLPGGGTLFIYEKPGHEPASYTALSFVVADIDIAVDELTENGVIMERYENLFPGAEQDDRGILRSPDIAKYGPTIGWFKDPAGNTIALIQD